MADPRPAGAPVDTERVIRDLLDAFKSLKGVTASATCSPPDNSDQQERSQQSPNDPAKALELIGITLSNAADPRLQPTTHFNAPMVPVSDFDEGGSQPAAAVERYENLESSDFQIEAQSTESGVIEGFCRDH